MNQPLPIFELDALGFDGGAHVLVKLGLVPNLADMPTHPTRSGRVRPAGQLGSRAAWREYRGRRPVAEISSRSPRRTLDRPSTASLRASRRIPMGPGDRDRLASADRARGTGGGSHRGRQMKLATLRCSQGERP